MAGRRQRGCAPPHRRGWFWQKSSRGNASVRAAAERAASEAPCPTTISSPTYGGSGTTPRRSAPNGPVPGRLKRHPERPTSEFDSCALTLVVTSSGMVRVDAEHQCDNVRRRFGPQRAGHFGLRAHVDQTGAAWRNYRALGGGADRRTQRTSACLRLSMCPPRLPRRGAPWQRRRAVGRMGIARRLPPREPP